MNTAQPRAACAVSLYLTELFHVIPNARDEHRKFGVRPWADAGCLPGARLIFIILIRNVRLT
jgi:hypothetical protein